VGHMSQTYLSQFRVQIRPSVKIERDSQETLVPGGRWFGGRGCHRGSLECG
jgi:hypothetical protein